ncbi:fungal specific transcription factor, putative [Talaromyces stipitatus ATCC 10500]|uniref:Fungal specific transcription factor, putative n=1 Tax=Talaromyces stipitatus (strain ATCC 10500 / CBS 375.48 / QM 6759 / NRRL 1006) TaxID=441959 RepID=B8LT01_TALSN|nr:fungal specific transcription factor, putative [Talaromyces stipitatus ATCC 10500]EED22997.1 fungal specific transcription factor, putative [Talaromyces stipitatus ATCC 10500]
MPPKVLGVGPSCNECRRRKIKCDRSIPCSYCVKTGIHCIYPESALETGGHEDLQDRIQGIELRLQSLEGGISEIKQLLQMSLARQHEQRDLVKASPTNHGATVSNDTTDIEMVPWSTEESMKPRHSQPAFLSTDPLPMLSSLHPSPTIVILIWQRFIDSIDSLLKLFHIPSLQRQIVNAIRALDRVEPYIECQMFAIYYCTVVDMPSDDCQYILGEKKGTLVSRYRAAVETALARVDLLNSPNIASLQAFVLYLSCAARDEQGPDAHTLIGVAIRNAIRLKLHHHGTTLGYLPFEAEMRRRLWWQICVIDVCMAVEHDTEPVILEKSFNTPFPSNVNDSMLDPDMKELPASLTGKSEMLFTLLRFEICYFARQIIFSEKFCRDNFYAILSATEKCEAVDAFRSRIEAQYLVHFNTITAFADRVVIAVRSVLDTLKRVPDGSSTHGIQLDLREVFRDIRHRESK